MSRYFLETMTDAYLEAAEFTDGEEASEDEVFSTQFKVDAYEACLNFENACATLEIDLRQYSAEQVGHDLWLTRNGHGAGFWDRPEVYGKHTDLFTGMARAQGYHDSEFV
jgi:hypothetical protein